MYQKFIILGRLTKDPELRISQSGGQVCKFSVAVDGYKKDQTEFFNCVAFNKLGEMVNNYATKGRMVFIEGRLQITQNEGKYYTSVLVDTFKLLDKKPEQSGQFNSKPKHSKQKEENTELKESDFDFGNPSEDIPF